MSKFYGYKAWEIKRLTLPQLSVYLSNLPYVLEWSESFGKPPTRKIIEDDAIHFAVMVGINVPERIRLANQSRE